MTLVGEAIARYHKLIESEPYIDLGWAQALQERKKALKLEDGPLSPVLRPHLISARDYAAMAKASESLLSAIDRVERMALANPALLARVQLLPAERMLAAVDPGYSAFSVAATLHTQMNDGSIRFSGHSGVAAPGAIYSEALSDLYYDAPPVKELRKRFKLKKLPGVKPLLQRDAQGLQRMRRKEQAPQYRDRRVSPASGLARTALLLADFFTREGFPTEVVSPDHLEYPQRRAASRRVHHRLGLSQRQAAGVSGPLRSESSAGARRQGTRRMHDQQLPHGAALPSRRCSIC